jgi:pyruvate dehydrogenase E2 component (dihydrolipoamide acetyltransferase)
VAHLLLMPAVAANAAEAVLSDWPVPENTPFAAGDAIATIETEKAVVDVPAEEAGVILKGLVAVGVAVEIGAPIALLGAVGEAVEDLDAVLADLGVAPGGRVATEPAATTAPAEPAATTAPAASESVPPSPAPVERTGGRIFSSPLARRLAKAAGMSIAELIGTGPGGRIVRRDVERAVDARRAPAAEPIVEVQPRATPPAALPPVPAPGTYDDIPHTRMRRAIAARLTQSVRDAPHFALQGTASVDGLLELRAKLNEYAPTKISINDLVVLAAARAHVLVPAMNVLWLPDAVRRFSAVDIAVAVSTDRGLVTPVLRGVDRMTVSAVAAAGRDLVDRARSGKLREEELAGGTLTVTNLGVFGTESFAAIINPPQSAILAVGAARQEPVVREGELAVATVMHVTLSVDHRPIDGALAAEWLAAFLSLMEQPLRILA